MTNYLWDETSPYGDVVYEADGNGDPLAAYGLANGALITQARNEETSFYLADGQGSVRGLAGASGLLTDEYRYSAYGALQTHTGANENPYLYTGQQYDAATALYSLRARYYAPEAGRFLSRDTYPLDAADPAEWNRYGYTAGNPVNRVDPSGNVAMAELAPRYKSISVSAPAVATTGVAIATKYILIYLVFTMPVFMLFADVISAALPDTDVDAPPTEADLWRQLWPNAKIGIDTYSNIKPEPKQKPDPKQATIVPPLLPTPETTRERKCNASAFISWWDSMEDILSSRRPNDPYYLFENRVARANGLYGEYAKNIPSGPINADGIEPSCCYLVEAKYCSDSGKCQYRFGGPPWIEAGIIQELMRYHAAITTTVGSPGAQPLGLIIRTNNKESVKFFKAMLLQAGFIHMGNSRVEVIT